MTQTTHFLLVPDSTSARRVRRELTRCGGRLGVSVGTWEHLLQSTRDCYLLPEPSDDWMDQVAAQLDKAPKAFWTESFRVAPRETAEEIEGMLTFLLEGLSPANSRLQAVTSGGRWGQQVSDLARLQGALSSPLPPHLQTVESVCRGDLDSVRTLRVYVVDEMPALDAWERKLVEQLNADAAEPEDDELQRILEYVLRQEPSAPESTALGLVQRHLFSKWEGERAQDSSLQWVAVRDPLEEAELVVGMIQTAMVEDPSLQPNDFGILHPASAEYVQALISAAGQGGLPLSGLNRVDLLQDLGRELIHNFLQFCEPTKPLMSAAAVLASPLMPFDSSTGAELSAEVAGSYRALKGGPNRDRATNTICKMLRLGASSPEELKTVLPRLLAFLEANKQNSIRRIHYNAAHAAVKTVVQLLDGADEVPWAKTLAATAPEMIQEKQELLPEELTREGVAVFDERHEPWRDVKHLFVLGFQEDAYPSQSLGVRSWGREAIEWMQDAGLSVESPEERLAKGRQRFLRQLRCASRSATFTMSMLGGDAESQRWSATLGFMAGVLKADPERLGLALEKAEHRKQIRYLPAQPEFELEPEFEVQPEDIHLDADLTALRKDQNGDPKPQSPSRLEKLLLSPLAWVLVELDVQEDLWSPQSLDPMTLGTVAHAVFEEVFRKDEPVPADDKIPDLVRSVFETVLLEHAPFAQAPHLRLSVKALEAETIRSAQTWGDFLRRAEATVLLTEGPLRGTFEGLPIRGTADVVLRWLNGGLFVVDYKRARSNGRIERMKSGWDHQVELYRRMLRGHVEKGDLDLTGVAPTEEIGIMYFTMRDGQILADSALAESLEGFGAHAFPNDVSEAAIEKLQEALGRLKLGHIVLGSVEDEEELKKVSLYLKNAFEVSPLVQRFLKPVPNATEVTP